MAYVLSLRPHSPLKRSFSETPYLRSCPPLKDDMSNGSLRYLTPRNMSTTSLNSLVSNRAGVCLRGSENTPPGLIARSALDLVHELAAEPVKPQPSMDVYHRSNPASNTAVPSFSDAQKQYKAQGKDNEGWEDKIIDEARKPLKLTPRKGHKRAASANSEASNCFDVYHDALQIPLPDGRFSDSTETEQSVDEDQSPPLVIEISPPPFKRWMSTLRKRHAGRRKDRTEHLHRWSADLMDSDPGKLLPPPHAPESLRRKSESMSSSLGFVTTVKSATITLASTSVAHRSQKGSAPIKLRIENRSSNFSETRISTDSNSASLGPIIDEGAWLRSIQRRKILEELISSEESYIGDLKILINVRTYTSMSEVFFINR